MAKTPEDFDYTSIKQRVKALKIQMPFIGNPRLDMPKGIAFTLKDYCDLIDTTGRCIRQDKSGYIDNAKDLILTRPGLDSEQWLTLTTEPEKHSCYAVGSE